MRLQTFLSHNGICSRRKAMELIQSGRVQVNGIVVQEPSLDILPSRDKVFVDAQAVERKSYQYVLLHKPSGYVTTTTDQYGEKTALDLLPKALRYLHPVGRLDKDTEGLLLLTNDGEAAYRLTHPKFAVDKIYLVRINRPLTQPQKILLEKGVILGGKRTALAKISKLLTIVPQHDWVKKKPARTLSGYSQFEITIHEGRKRQISLMLECIGHKVIHLKRIAQGPLTLDSLNRGQWRFLEGKEIELLKKVKG